MAIAQMLMPAERAKDYTRRLKELNQSFNDLADPEGRNFGQEALLLICDLLWREVHPQLVHERDHLIQVASAIDAADYAGHGNMTPTQAVQRAREIIAAVDGVDYAGVPPTMIAKIRVLHDLVDLTDPKCPVGVALTIAGLEQRP